MTGLLRKAMLFACCGVLAASYAMAAIPSPADSDIPCGINLVTTVSGAADPHPFGTVTIVVRDVAQNPIPGSSVVIDFDACVGPSSASDIRLCSAQPHPGVTATCTSPVGEISAVTDGSGSVVLRVVGASQGGPAATTAAGINCATVYADGINLGTINVGTFDMDSGGGLLNDASVWKQDYIASINPPFPVNGRGDFDCSGVLLNDLSVWFTVYNASIGLTATCASFCP